METLKPLTGSSKPMGSIPEETIEVQARDGYPLEATRFSTQGRGDHVTIMAPAMGVKRGFYAPFCRTLARRGHTVVSLDYRGIGGSAPDGGLRGFDGRLLDWARLDLAGVIDHALETHNPSSFALAGHSVGGQLLGLVPNAARFDRVLMVASVKGYWRLWSGREAVMLWLLSHVVAPLMARAWGYFPARWAGLGGEDLPQGVAREWARWIRHPEYIVDETGQHPAAGFEAYTGEIRAISLSDDWYAPGEGVAALVEMYPNADRAHEILSPADLGLDAIGHFGFFRPDCRPLWPGAAAWLADGQGSVTKPAGAGEA